MLKLETQEIVRLIRKDPVTCALYFEHKLRQLFIVIRSKNCIFEQYDFNDSYICMEFQSRGSPHAHCLVWLKGAPIYKEGDPESTKLCEAFVNLFVSCQY